MSKRGETRDSLSAVDPDADSPRVATSNVPLQAMLITVSDVQRAS